MYDKVPFNKVAQLPDLAEKSNRLMMENVKLNGYIYENYNAITGNVEDLAEGKRMGDNYYHRECIAGVYRNIGKRR